MRVDLPLESFNGDDVPVRVRAVFATNVTGYGRIAVTLMAAGWSKLGRPATLSIELPEPKPEIETGEQALLEPGRWSDDRNQRVCHRGEQGCPLRAHYKAREES